MTTFDPSYSGTPARQSNGIGTAGFVISLLGVLLTGGLLCPIGLILSLVGLGTQPRGLATAGVVLGIIGTCLVLPFMVFFGGMMLVALGIAAAAAFIALANPQQVEVTADMAQIAESMQGIKRQTGDLPQSIDELAIEPEMLIDPWGSAYSFSIDPDLPGGFDIVSAGPDRAEGTLDDLRFSKLEEYWEEFFTSSIHETDGALTMEFAGRTIEMIGEEGAGELRITYEDGKTIVLKGDNVRATQASSSAESAGSESGSDSARDSSGSGSE